MSDFQPTPREPLHQPPDPHELRRVPPASPECACVRGMLRDYADGDLTPKERTVVELHLHGCRTCSVALARAEHEALRLRLAFAGEAPATPREGFAGRVVDRLVLDETSLLSRDSLDRAMSAVGGASAGSAAGGPATVGPAAVVPVAVGMGAGRQAGGGAAASSRFPRLLAMLLGGAAVLAVAMFGVLAGEDHRPERSARLVVMAAADAYFDNGTRLHSGVGLGDDQGLRVGQHGQARIDWHDASSRSQPAATLEVREDGQVKMLHGEPVVLNGRLLVESKRPVTVAIGDGSRIELGAGEYAIGVEDLNALHRGRLDRMESSKDSRVSIEVLRGESARVLRQASAPTLVDAGQLGIYRGNGPVDIQAGPSTVLDPGSAGIRRREPVLDPEPRDALLRGTVLERNGAAAAGAEVVLSFGSRGLARSTSLGVDVDGRFALATGPLGSASACDSPFAIVQVLPSWQRPDLGLTVPEAIRLIYQSGDASLATSPVLDVSMPLVGTVVDEDGLPRGDARVLPCVVDELFQTVLVWADGAVATTNHGGFRLPRLPVALQDHQYLAVLILHGQLEPTLVAVPIRNSMAASLSPDRFVVPRRHKVRLTSLPVGMPLQLYEEIAGMPLGSAAVRYNIVPDASGTVAELYVGRGRLWLRQGTPSLPLLRRMQPEDPSDPVLFRVSQSEPVGFDSMFLPLANVAGSDVLLANSFRFERCNLLPGQGGARSVSIAAIDGRTDRSIPFAQVFAVGHSGPRALPAVRFLGFTSPTGILSADLATNEDSIVVLGPDGCVAGQVGVTAGPVIELLLQATGGVVVDPSLMPAGPGADGTVALEFERLGNDLAGLRVDAVRFALAAQGWSVDGLIPGTYRMRGPNLVRTVEITAGERTLLH